MKNNIFLKNLEVKCIIGIYDWERKKKQRVLISFGFPHDTTPALAHDHIDSTINYKKIAKYILEFTSKSKYYLVEALAENLCRQILTRFDLPFITLSVSKPGAIRYAANVGIEISKYRWEYTHHPQEAYISLGSNLNAPVMMAKALELIREECKVIKASSVYESTAVGLKMQPAFLNQTIQILTALTPLQLKKQLQTFENCLGRKRTIDKYAPRVMDCDIIFYANKVIQTNKLRIPHPDAKTAPYLLATMCEVNPHYVHPQTKKTMIEMSGEIMDKKGVFRRVNL